MIGVIGALDVEISYIIEKMESARTETISTVTFTSGKINGKDIVCAVCGIGKVFAAMCAQTMILKFHHQSHLQCLMIPLDHGKLLNHTFLLKQYEGS